MHDNPPENINAFWVSAAFSVTRLEVVADRDFATRDVMKQEPRFVSNLLLRRFMDLRQ
jgi:hypothetical protein